MNEKFFELPVEKQDAIINGALRVFSMYEYKKASTDEIAKSAGVSKALLFHYFENKKGLYKFCYDYTVEYVVTEMSKQHNYDETDFFQILVDAVSSKLRIVAKHPDIMEFATKSYFEESPEVKPFIKKTYGTMIADSSQRFLKRADITKFKEGVDPAHVLNIILWMSDGFSRSINDEQRKDIKKVYEEYFDHLEEMRKQFYKPEFI